ncbi:MAG: helix-turn-helix domain-containing protein [Tannerella sp.]|nr:helix-turn-helix domain-containing protein [Tannerella sp.]
MPAYKVGKQWKFKISEIDEWIRSGESAKIVE